MSHIEVKITVLFRRCWLPTLFTGLRNICSVIVEHFELGSPCLCNAAFYGHNYNSYRPIICMYNRASHAFRVYRCCSVYH